jgi:hypothetical protein
MLVRPAYALNDGRIVFFKFSSHFRAQADSVASGNLLMETDHEELVE